MLSLKCILFFPLCYAFFFFCECIEWLTDEIEIRFYHFYHRCTSVHMPVHSAHLLLRIRQAIT